MDLCYADFATHSRGIAKSTVLFDAVNRLIHSMECSDLVLDAHLNAGELSGHRLGIYSPIVSFC